MCKLKAFFSYYGSKVRSAKYYPEPKYNCIIEPFAGAAGYSLRYSDRNVVLYDINPVITGIWSYLIRTSSEEIMRLPVEGECLDDFHVCNEAKSLIGFWFARSSTYPRGVRSPWSKQHKSWGWNEHIRLRIASQVDKIRHWKVYTGSYYDIVNTRASWFIDPPYVNEGVRYTHHTLDYTVLSLWCRGRWGQIMVCEGASGNWLPFESMGKFNSVKKHKIEKLYYLER